MLRQTENSDPDPRTEGYEKRDVSANKVIIWGVVGVVIVIVAVVWLIDYFAAVREEMVYDSVLKPQSVALRELRAREEKVLGSYELLDSAEGRYRIPVDRAIELVADEAFRRRSKDAPGQ